MGLGWRSMFASSGFRALGYIQGFEAGKQHLEAQV